MQRRTPMSPWRRRLFRFWVPFRVLRGHPRLFGGIATGLLAELFLPGRFALSTRLLIDWNVGTWFYFIATGIMIARATPETIRRRAKTTDEGKIFILVLTSVAAIAAIAAIVAHLAAGKDLSGTQKAMHIGLAALTIVSAWSFIHLTYALHYAHEYFDECRAKPGEPASVRGGLVFPGDDVPDYYDFLYFSYVIGVACQTADIGLSSHEMRRVALIHCVLAFFFNSAVLAFTINVAAGMI